MNFLLRNIEIQLDEQSFVRSEELLAEQAVQSLREIDKHLWEALVKDGDKVYEVEAKISPSRVLAGSCECERHQDIGMCEHLGALLFLLRRRQADKQKRKKNASKKLPRKLTNNAVLDSVTHEELIAFVRQYAKTNRNFSLALKTRFAPQVSLEETKEKYSQLLESAISMARKADRSISLRGSQKIYQVLLEMQHQIDDAIVRKFYADAFHIIQSIFEKITPILKKLEHSQDEIREQINQCFQSLQEIIGQQPPPALRADIWEFCLGESNKLRFRNNNLDAPLFRVMLSLADEKKKKEQLANTLSEVLFKYEYEGRNPAPILLIQLQILEAIDQKDQVQSLLDRYLTEPDILRFAIRQAVQRKDFAKVKMMAHSGLEKKLPPAIQAELEDTLLYIAEQEKDKTSIIDLSLRRLTQSLNIRYAHTLKTATGRQWKKYRRLAIESLSEQTFSRNRAELIGQLLANDASWEALLDHLKKTHSLELLQQFDQHLLPTHRADVYQLYRQILGAYLSNHLGRKPSTRIRQTLLHLHEMEAGDLVRELVEQFRNNYPERHTLMEELSLF